MSIAYETYKSVGNETYGKLVCELAPYFSTIDPQFVDMKPGYVEKQHYRKAVGFYRKTSRLMTLSGLFLGYAPKDIRSGDRI